MDERQRLPDSFQPEVTYEQHTGVDGQPDLWSYFLGPDGYLWWTSEAAGVTQNLESWNRHHWGENWRTDDPVFGFDDIEPQEAERENQNSAATSVLQIATNLAEAIRAARRHQAAAQRASSGGGRRSGAPKPARRPHAQRAGQWATERDDVRSGGAHGWQQMSAPATRA